MGLISIGAGIYLNPEHIVYIGYVYAHVKYMGVRLTNGQTLEFHEGTASYVAMEAFIETHSTDPRK